MMVEKLFDEKCKFERKTYQILWTIEKFNLIPFIRGNPIRGPIFRLGKNIDNKWQLHMSKERDENGLKMLGFMLSKVEMELDTVWDSCIYTITIKSKDDSNVLVCIQNNTVGAKDDLMYRYVNCFPESNTKETSEMKCDPTSEDCPQIDAHETALPTSTTRDVFVQSSKKAQSNSAILNLLLDQEVLLVQCDITHVYMVDHFDETLEEPMERLIVKDLEAMYKSQKFSDIILCAGGSEFRAHKSMLCLRAYEFDVMLQERRAAYRVPIQKLELDLTESVAKMMLRHIYTGQFPQNLNLRDCLSLLSASYKYGINPLKEHCRKVLNDLIDGLGCIGYGVKNIKDDSEAKMRAFNLLQNCKAEDKKELHEMFNSLQLIA